MDSLPHLRYLIAGELRRDFIITGGAKAHLDIPGGSLMYAAAGFAVWESGAGLLGRVGSDYPVQWLQEMERRGFDCRGIQILPEPLDLRSFTAYAEDGTLSREDALKHFGRIGLPFPQAMMGYNSKPLPLPPLYLRAADLPAEYLDCTAAHLCPLDLESHSLLLALLAHTQVTTITLEPHPAYMDADFLGRMPTLLKGVTALLVSEKKLSRLFMGRITDLWQMAEAAAGFGVEFVVIQRGAQGQYLYNAQNQTRWVVPAYPVKRVDPTGAGDAFCGGFLAGFGANYDPLTAVMWGNISASLTLEGSGAFFALDAMPELAQRRLESLQQMVRKI